MPSPRTLVVALVAAATLTLGGCGATDSTTPTTTASAPTTTGTAQATPTDAPPSGGAGAGPTGKAMTSEATARMAKDLGVTPTELTAAITKARAGGAGVNLVKTLSSELNLPEATVAAELKTMGPDGP